MSLFDLKARLGLDSSAFNRGISLARSGISSFAKVSGAALVAASGAMVAFGKKSIDVGMEFDKSMSQVAATMGISMDEMQDKIGEVDLAWGHFSGNLREYAQEMGKNTAFSATQAADALNYMALAGYDAQTSMNMLPNVLNLAAAGAMDLATASDMITDTQTAFGISLDRTSQMVDEMAKAASTGNTSVSQLGEAFLVVGGLAAELNGGVVTLSNGMREGVDGVQELEIALTAMANAGVKGSEAGTHMRNMLLKLASPTSEGTIALEKMGVTVFDAAGNMRSLSDVFGDLSKNLDSMTQEKKIQTIATLFNTRDLASAEALLKAVNQDWDAIGESILNSKYSLKEIDDAVRNSGVVWDKYKEKAWAQGGLAVEELTSQIRYNLDQQEMSVEETADFISLEYGMSMQDALLATNAVSKAIESATGAAQKMADTQLDNLAGDITLFKSALEGAQITISDVLSPTLREFVQFGTSGISDLTSAFQKGGLSGAMGEFGKILSNLVQMVVKKVPELVRGAVQLLKAFVGGLIDNADLVIDAAFEIVDILVNEFLNAENLTKLVDSAFAIIGKLANGLAEALPKLLPAVVGIILAIVNALTSPDNLSSLIDAAIALLVGLANGLIESIDILLDKAPEIIENLVVAIIENAPKLLDASVELVAVLIGGILSELGEKLGEVASFVWNWFSEKVLTPVGNFFSEIWKKIQNFFQPLLDFISPILNGLSELFSAIWGAIKKVVGDAIDEIWNTVTETWDSIVSFLDENIFSPLLTLFTNVWNSLYNKVHDPIDKMKTFVGGAFDWIKNKITGIVESAWSWGQDLIDNFVGGISSFVHKIGDTLSGVAQKIKDFIGFSEPKEGPLSNFHTFAPDMIDLFAQGVKENEDALQRQIAETFDFGDLIRGGFGEVTYSTTGTGSVQEQLLGLLSRYLPQLANMQVVMDTGAVVGELRDGMNQSLGEVGRFDKRGMATA